MKHIEKASKHSSSAKRSGWALGVAAALVLAFGGAVAGGAVVAAGDGLKSDGGQVAAKTLRW